MSESGWIAVRSADGTLLTVWVQGSGDGATEFTIGGEIPGIDESMAELIRKMMEGSVSNITALIESETSK